MNLNIIHIAIKGRRGLVDNIHGGFGLVDNLSMTYEGNMLTSVCDSASRYSYASATDFDGVTGQVYPLTYNGSGSLVSDAGRKIAHSANCKPNCLAFSSSHFSYLSLFLLISFICRFLTLQNYIE